MFCPSRRLKIADFLALREETCRKESAFILAWFLLVYKVTKMRGVFLHEQNKRTKNDESGGR